MRLLLLRHGQTHANVLGSLDTAAPGPGLTEFGQRQAHAASMALRKHPITGLYITNLIRTDETARPFLDSFAYEPQVLVGAREISAGDYERHTSQESIEGYLGTVTAWLDSRLEVRMPGAENGHEFLERYDDAVTQIVDAGHDTALLVSHGAAMRTWLTARTTNWQDFGAARTLLHNTSCIELVGNGRTWEVVNWSSEPVGAAYLSRADSDPGPSIFATEER